MPVATEIPIVSFAPFLHGSREEQNTVAQQVYDAFSTVGFIYLKDHGIAQSEVEAVFREVGHFTIFWLLIISPTLSPITARVTKASAFQY